MRSIETLAYEYPEKTCAEIIDIQKQEKKVEDAIFLKEYEKKSDFNKDIMKNGGYFKCIDEFDEKRVTLFKITEIELTKTGVMYFCYSKITVFYNDAKPEESNPSIYTIPRGEIEFTKRLIMNKKHNPLIFLNYNRITKKEWDNVESYIDNVPDLFK